MIDCYDMKVIECLMRKARTSWADLGAMLGMSAPAAAERVRKLEEKGVIKGYCADINPEAVGLTLAAFIAVTLERPESREGFLRVIYSTPEIQECHHVAGDDDYWLKVRCKNTRDLEKLISEKVKGIKGVARTRTTIILSTTKETSVLPISGMEADV